MLSVSPGGKVTLQDVAAKAGVSISTASRSLTHAGNVAQGTEARVLAVAEALGYHYNPLLGEVMRSTRRGDPNHYLGTLAYITPYDDVQEWRATPTLCRHWSAAREQAALFGFGVTEFALTSHGMTARRLGEILRARGITGDSLGRVSQGSLRAGPAVGAFRDGAGRPHGAESAARLRGQRSYAGRVAGGTGARSPRHDLVTRCVLRKTQPKAMRLARQRDSVQKAPPCLRRRGPSPRQSVCLTPPPTSAAR
jgi:transcriptional regulator with XRE-family HTH domain